MISLVSLEVIALHEAGHALAFAQAGAKEIYIQITYGGLGGLCVHRGDPEVSPLCYTSGAAAESLDGLDIQTLWNLPSSRSDKEKTESFFGDNYSLEEALMWRDKYKDLIFKIQRRILYELYNPIGEGLVSPVYKRKEILFPERSIWIPGYLRDWTNSI